jgi:NADPH-dependent 2,4-dienoyl-CoA reductase/sulfur reductase-like enzyme
VNDATKTDPLKLLILGGVAGGATAAARARRVNEDAEITIVERGPYVSYANCGLPYFISGDIAERSSLLLETPQGFARRYRVDALVNTDALEIDRTAKRVRVQAADGTRWLEYDRLILAQGGTPIRPTFPGSDAPHVFTLWTVPDTDRMDAYMRDRAPKSAVVVGGGFIGLEWPRRSSNAASRPRLSADAGGDVADGRAFGVQVAMNVRCTGVGDHGCCGDGRA